MLKFDRPMRILVTNDDGIRAPGIDVLEHIARQLSDDVWVVAPHIEQSGVGHSLTFRNPLRLTEVSPRHYYVDGTPTDCVILALEKVLKDNPPDLVLSGINHGENLAESMTQSGTIGATIQATLQDIPAIALSQVTKEAKEIDWTVAKKHGPELISKLVAEPWEKNVLMNINFPYCALEDVTGIRLVPHGKRENLTTMVECVDPRDNPYYWTGALREQVNLVENTDLKVVQENYISVTPLHLNLTHHGMVDKLGSALNCEFGKESNQDQDQPYEPEFKKVAT